MPTTGLVTRSSGAAKSVPVAAVVAPLLDDGLPTTATVGGGSENGFSVRDEGVLCTSGPVAMGTGFLGRFTCCCCCCI